MRPYLLFGLIIIFNLFLGGCVSSLPPSASIDFSQEIWMRNIHTNTYRWTFGADNWFLTGDANETEMANRYAPYSAAISTMRVRAPYFTDIKSNGDFQVQIFGTDGLNSVFVYGPNAGVRNVVVEVHGNTLCLGQMRPASLMHRVIIRIGIRRLHHLIQRGCGRIEGRQIYSDALFVTATGSGNIYLAGNINLLRVENWGNASINLFHVYAPCLDINTS